MKMPKEYVLVLIIGLFLLAYLLEAVVDPLALPLTTPYQFFSADNILKVPFTTAVIGVRALAVFITPLWLLSFLSGAFQFKAVTLLVVSVLVQLYSVQSIASNTVGLPLEWSISLAAAGLLLFLPMLIFFVKGAMGNGKKAASPNEIGSLADDDSSDDF